MNHLCSNVVILEAQNCTVRPRYFSLLLFPTASSVISRGRIDIYVSFKLHIYSSQPIDEGRWEFSNVVKPRERGLAVLDIQLFQILTDTAPTALPKGKAGPFRPRPLLLEIPIVHDDHGAGLWLDAVGQGYTGRQGDMRRIL